LFIESPTLYIPRDGQGYSRSHILLPLEYFGLMAGMELRSELHQQP
jgi:hypothetical protein